MVAATSRRTTSICPFFTGETEVRAIETVASAADTTMRPSARTMPRFDATTASVGSVPESAHENVHPRELHAAAAGLP